MKPIKIYGAIALALVASLAIEGCGNSASKRRRSGDIGGSKAETSSSSEASTEAAVEKKKPDPATFGTLKVKAVYAGRPKKNKALQMGSDAACVSVGEKDAKAQVFLRNEDNTMQNVVVYLSKGHEGWITEDASEKALLDQKGCIYVPHVLNVQARQEIEFKNSDPTLHNVHPKPKKNKEVNKATGKGASVTHAFTRPEVGIKVKCDVHPWMTGYISVFKHPYHGVTTNADGANGDAMASIANVPAGKYTISGWHEELGSAKAEVEVKAGQDNEVTITFK